MITFVICSVCPERSADVARNIRSTSGIAEPEIFIHDNREVNWSLCKVYNHYSPKASNDIICYVHEDLYFRTRDWAEKIVSFYRDNPDTGVVGFLGSQIKTKAPSAVGCDPEIRIRQPYSAYGGRKGQNVYEKIRPGSLFTRRSDRWVMSNCS